MRLPAIRPIRLVVSSLILAASTLGTAAPACASKVMFGNQEHLEKLQDVDVKGLNGELLYLGYKYTHHAFIAPYYVSDDGYILGVRGQNRYYKLDADKIVQLQSQGLLPKPLPPYELSLVDYLVGYLAWFILAALAVGIWLSHRKNKRQNAALPIANAGLALERNGDYRGAVAKYDKALEAAPDYIDVYCRRANCHHNLGNLDKAIADYSKAISGEPKNVMALIGRGGVFEAKEMTRAAIEDYSRAIKASKAAIGYFLRGGIHSRNGDHAAAINDFTAVIRKEPHFAAAYGMRAQSYDAAGDPARATADRAKHAQLAGLQPALPAR